MLYIFMGQGCTGKTTVADKIKELIDAEVFSGKDYLRMAKNENEAWRLFYERLIVASSKEESTENIIYLITEKAQLDRVIDIQNACKVKFTSSLDTIKSRFAQRMHGKLPTPVETMIDKQYEEWRAIVGDINVDTTVDNIEEIISNIRGIDE